MRKGLFFLLLSVSITSCSQKSSQNVEWIPFTWESDSISGKYFEKLAMYIPIKIDELPYKFNMQFDLGAGTTMFYGNTLKPFLYEYSSLNNKLDTINKIWLRGIENNPVLRNLNLRLGEVILKNIDVGLNINYGTEYILDSINSETGINIGTIGADWVQNKVLIIDYQSNRLLISDSLPTEYQNASFENFIIDHGLIKIPFRINGKIEHLMFDTGSSIFTLTTTKQNALAIGGAEIADSLTVTSWGEYVTFYGLETVVPIMIGNKTIKSSIVYYTEDTSWDEFYQRENMWGLTGNAYFFNDVVIIDYKNNRFGVK